MSANKIEAETHHSTLSLLLLRHQNSTILKTDEEVHSMDNVKMGELIRDSRKEKGLTQKDVANKLGITDRAVSKWERGVSQS